MSELTIYAFQYQRAESILPGSASCIDVDLMQEIFKERNGALILFIFSCFTY